MATISAVQVPTPISAGPEMAALRRFFPDVTWKGTVVENGMGPGTPEMPAVSRGFHRTIQDGLWVVGDYEQDQFLADGAFVLKWQLHWVVGWDSDSGEYRDPRRQLRPRRRHARPPGRGRLTFETMGEGPVRQRMIWDLTDPSTMTWRNEISFGGGPFSLVEEYEFKATGPGAEA